MEEKRQKVTIKVMRQRLGFGYYPYWWSARIKDPHEYQSGGAFFKVTATWRARKAARKMQHTVLPDEEVLEEVI
jgi:hypothetical protein